MCLQVQGIDNDGGGIGGGKRAQGTSDNNIGVGGGRGIDNKSEVSETTAEAARIQGRRRRLWRCNYGTEELSITTEVLTEEDEPEY